MLSAKFYFDVSGSYNNFNLNNLKKKGRQTAPL